MKFHFLSPKIYDWLHLLKSYRKYVSKEDTVLEIGASSPERTKELSRWCKKIIGVELIPERKPKDFANVKYLVGDWQNLSKLISPGSVDLAISSHTIEHVQDDLKAINELYKVLKPGGVVLFNTPNRERFTRKIVESFSKKRQFPYWEHIREYSENDLSNLLNKTLFKNYKIFPVVFGFHGRPIFFYLESVPGYFREMANYWEVHLKKEK